MGLDLGRHDHNDVVRTATQRTSRGSPFVSLIIRFGAAPISQGHQARSGLGRCKRKGDDKTCEGGMWRDRRTHVCHERYMTFLRRHINLLRFVSIVATGSVLAACMKWQTQSLQPERFREADKRQKVRLILRSGDTLVVSRPVIVGDSLVGRRSDHTAGPDRVSVPLAAIRESQISKRDHATNAMLAVLVTVGSLVALSAFIESKAP